MATSAAKRVALVTGKESQTSDIQDGKGSHLHLRLRIFLTLTWLNPFIRFMIDSSGGNKGIGYHIVDQLARGDSNLTVLLGSRTSSNGESALKSLNSPANVKSIIIDIDDENSIKKAVEHVKKEYDGLDILVNNAGMAFKGDAFDEDVVKKTFHTNYYVRHRLQG